MPKPLALLLTFSLCAAARSQSPDHERPEWWLAASARDAAFILTVGDEAQTLTTSKVHFLGFAAAGLSLAGQEEAGRPSLRLARSLVETLDDPYDRDAANWTVCWAQACGGAFDEAKQTAAGIEDAGLRLAATADIAFARAQRGDRAAYAKALADTLAEVDRSMRRLDADTDEVAWVVGVVAELQVDVGDLDGARQTLERYASDPATGADAYGALAAGYARTGQPEEARRMVGKARAAMEAARKQAADADGYDDSYARLQLVSTHAELGETERARAMVQGLAEMMYDGEAMAMIAAAHARRDEAELAAAALTDAFERSARYGDVDSRAWAYQQIAWTAAEAGLAGQLVEPIGRLGTPIERAAARGGAGHGLLERRLKASLGEP